LVEFLLFTMGAQIWRILRHGGGLGDAMMASHFVHILNEHGVPAIYEGFAMHLVTCPTSRSRPVDTPIIDWVFDYDWISDVNMSIIDGMLAKFQSQFGPLIGEKHFHIKHPGVPVKYLDVRGVFGADVALVTKTGYWSRIRDYPFFSQLKALLDSASISYIDITECRLMDLECLNVVRKSRVYVGLETGVSHLVSSFCDESNGLILQSGYVSRTFWAKYYRFDFLEMPQHCSPCYLRNVEDCKWGHACMAGISPEAVLDRIREKLDRMCAPQRRMLAEHDRWNLAGY